MANCFHLHSYTKLIFDVNTEVFIKEKISMSGVTVFYGSDIFLPKFVNKMSY